MTPSEVTNILRQFNEWRRADCEPSEQPEPPDPREIGEAIDAAVEMIERADRLEKVESALSDLLNDLEERAKWNLEASHRVVACGNGVYVRAKAALEKSK